MTSLLQSTQNTRSLQAGSLRYIRSDVPSKVTRQEMDWLAEHRITTIIDLRTTAELEKKPCPLQGDARFYYHHLPITGGNQVPISPHQVPQSYLDMVDERMMQAVTLAEQAATNVLYFCNAGKDRTGVLSALLLLRMGASRREIVADYLRSADALKEMLEGFARQNPEVDPVVITPQAVYMETFLDRIQEREVLPPPNRS